MLTGGAGPSRTYFVPPERRAESWPRPVSLALAGQFTFSRPTAGKQRNRRRGQAPALQGTASQRAGGHMGPPLRRDCEPSGTGGSGLPTAYLAPGAYARQRQAQSWNRTNGNFCIPRPQWAGKKRGPSLRFCAPEILHLQNRYASLVMGSGERRIWTRSVHPEPSPGAFWLLCRHGQSNPPSADGGIPLRTINLFLNLSPHPSGLTASHLPPRGKALKRSSPSGFSPPRGKA